MPRHKLETHCCDESNASEGSAELSAGGDILRAGVFTHWEPCLFHRFTFIGITRFLVVLFGFCLACLAGRFVVCVVLLVDWFSPFLHMGCTSSSSFPRLSPSSWWAQQWSKKKSFYHLCLADWRAICPDIPKRLPAKKGIVSVFDTLDLDVHLVFNLLKCVRTFHALLTKRPWDLHKLHPDGKIQMRGTCYVLVPARSVMPWTMECKPAITCV